MYLIFDTETTGLPKNWRAPISDTENWPRCVQLAWQVHDELGNLIESKSYIVKPDNFDIPYESEKIHGISTLLAEKEGIELDNILNEFNISISKSKFIIGHNVNFDLNVIGCEFYRRNIMSNIETSDVLDTCTELTAELCKIPGGRGGKFKLPTLTELHEFLFQSSFQEAHNASADVEATTRCFLELIRIKNFKKEQLQATEEYFEKFSENNPNKIEKAGIKHVNLKKKSEEAKLITLLVVCIALVISIEVTSIFNVFLVADLFAACLVFPAFYRIKKSSKDSLLIIPFVGSLISVYVYRYLFIDLQVNPGGIFIPTDLYGLADLNTFAVGLLSSMVITLVADKAIK